MLTAAPQASWERKNERQRVLTCSRNRGLEAVHKDANKAKWNSREEQTGVLPSAEQLLPKANPSARSFEENVQVRTIKHSWEIKG